METASLPGGDLVAKGLADLRDGRRTEESRLVQVAGPRLRALGFSVPEDAAPAPIYEHALYEMLEDRVGRGAHAAYNALIARIVSFENAAESLQSAARRRSVDTREVTLPET
jgi:hypothetical protein